MNFEHNRTEAADIIRIEGRLDASTAPEMQAGAIAALDGSGPLVLDLAEVDYVSSAGLRALLILLREATARERPLALAALTPDVSDVIRLTGFDKLLDVHSDVDTALAACI